MQRALVLFPVVLALALPFSGCGKEEEASTPVACLQGADAWLEALAPVAGSPAGPDGATVLIDDATPISDCIPPDQPAGQQETVGLAATGAATSLATVIKPGQGTGPDGPGALPGSERAALMAGYLVGALERGAERTQGIHAALVDRVTTAATNRIDLSPEPVRSSFERGREAGLESG